jgi:hypothetical protein
MTLAAARCVPRCGRSRPRPAQAPDPFLAGAAASLASLRPGGFVQAAVDAYARTGQRPPWLSDELLAVLEARGRLVGSSTCCTSTSPSATQPTRAGSRPTTPGSPRVQDYWRLSGGSVAVSSPNSPGGPG